MEPLRVYLEKSDIDLLYQEVTTEAVADAMKGFEMLTPDGERLLTFYMNTEGLIEIQVRSPRGSYAAVAEKTYENLNP